MHLEYQLKHEISGFFILCLQQSCNYEGRRVLLIGYLSGILSVTTSPLCSQTLLCEHINTYYLCFNYALQPLRLIVRSGLDVSTFATRRLHACHHARAPSGRRWNCGREISGKFCLNADFHVTFRDLLHAVKL